MLWTCSTCGEAHDNIPLSFAADFPDNYANLSSERRQQDALISSDQCILLEQKECYIRGCLEIPLRAGEGIFLWGVWANLRPEDFEKITETWETEGRENLIGPFMGRLANSLYMYPFETANLKLTVQIEPVGSRPLFFLDEPDHPFTRMQQEGITLQQARDLASRILHRGTASTRNDE